MANLDDSTFEAVNNGNFKIFGEMGGANALAHQNRCNIIAETAMVRALDTLNNTSVPEGLGIAAAQRGDISKIVGELGATVAGLQQLMKGAQTTPPVTP